jgi:pectinesterase
MKTLLLIVSLFFSFSITTFATESYQFVVASDGSGNFTRIQDAINAVPDLRKEETRIFIKPGIYKEKLTLPSTKINVTFIGENPLTTILTFDDYAQKKNSLGENIGTSGSSSFFIYGDGFTARNITFENSSGPVGQAVAVRIDGDKVRFFNCRFLGFQDTLYPHGMNSRQYYKDCYIEGTVDFIFGWSTVVFENCTLFCKSNGYVTAASTLENNPYGFVFIHCHITGNAPNGSFYLGRPWRPFAKVAYIECVIDKVINPKGWHDWNKPEAHQSTFYAEYNCTGAGADISQRVDWSKQLTAEQAKTFSLAEIFKRTPPSETTEDNWVPAE